VIRVIQQVCAIYYLKQLVASENPQPNVLIHFRQQHNALATLHHGCTAMAMVR
jgi:hypothetical protein